MLTLRLQLVAQTIPRVVVPCLGVLRIPFNAVLRFYIDRTEEVFKRSRSI
jgi:hypothetical protein